MSSTINANTSSGVVVTSDTSGVLQLQTAGTTAVTIDASQNVGVGTTTPDIFSRGYGRILGISESGNSGSAVQINSGASAYPALEMGRGGVRKFVLDAQSTKLEIASLEAVPMTFLTNSAEAMRIDSSGNLLVGSTTSNAKIYAVSSVDANTLRSYNSNATFSNNLILCEADRNTTNGSFYAYGYYNIGASAYKFKVLDSGNVQNTNNSYGAISDVKLKENILDATPKLAGLMQVQVRNYNLIGDTTKQIGVIAQELETVFPAMVEEIIDRDKDGNELGTTTKSVKYSVFVPMLIKAVQELSAQVTELKAEVALLKGV